MGSEQTFSRSDLPPLCQTFQTACPWVQNKCFQGQTSYLPPLCQTSRIPCPWVQNKCFQGQTSHLPPLCQTFQTTCPSVQNKRFRGQTYLPFAKLPRLYVLQFRTNVFKVRLTCTSPLPNFPDCMSMCSEQMFSRSDLPPLCQTSQTACSWLQNKCFQGQTYLPFAKLARLHVFGLRTEISKVSHTFRFNFGVKFNSGRSVFHYSFNFMNTGPWHL